MLLTGFKSTLDLPDIWEVREEDTAKESVKDLAIHWNRELRKLVCYTLKLLA